MTLDLDSLRQPVRGGLAGRGESSPPGERDWRVHPPAGRHCRPSSALARCTGGTGSTGEDRWAAADTAAAVAAAADAERDPRAAEREAAAAVGRRRPPAAAADSTEGGAAEQRWRGPALPWRGDPPLAGQRGRHGHCA